MLRFDYILSCPRCRYYSGNLFAEWPDSNQLEVVVVCSTCGLRGSYASTLQAAVDAWNTLIQSILE